ncbi:MAG: hypothetical protein ACTSVI_12705 [Promethearchaeota archaeon]
MNKKILINKIKSLPTREITARELKKYLKNIGFSLIENDFFDVVAQDRKGKIFLFKLWISPARKATPKHYVKKFDKDIQEFSRNEYFLIENMEAYLISNSILTNGAYNYFKSIGRYSFSLLFTFSNVHSLLNEYKEKERKKEERITQRNLMEFMAVA